MSLRSMLGLDGRTGDAGPLPGATHVLYFTPRDNHGYAAWYLVSVGDWCGDLLPHQWAFLGENIAGRDLAGEYCVSFAAEVLGFPVTADRFEVDLTGTRFWIGHGRLEPAYWITPAA